MDKSFSPLRSGLALEPITPNPPAPLIYISDFNMLTNDEILTIIKDPNAPPYILRKLSEYLFYKLYDIHIILDNAAAIFHSFSK